MSRPIMKHRWTKPDPSFLIQSLHYHTTRLGKMDRFWPKPRQAQTKCALKYKLPLVHVSHKELTKYKLPLIPGPTPWQDGARSNFLPSGGAQNLRRMTFCAPSANLGKRRPSFGGALRLKKFEKLSPVQPEKPDFLRLPGKPDFTAITPVKKLVQQFNQSVSYQ